MGIARRQLTARAAGTTATFFNDDTEGDAAGPDSLVITAPSSVTASGVTIVSSVDGHVQVCCCVYPCSMLIRIQDFTVETSTDGSHWQSQANVTGITSLAPSVQFPAAATFTALRITVTKNQNAGKLVYTRIAEVVLGDFAGDAAWPASTSASASSEHPPATEPSYAASNAVDGNPATFWNDVRV